MLGDLRLHGAGKVSRRSATRGMIPSHDIPHIPDIQTSLTSHIRLCMYVRSTMYVHRCPDTLSQGSTAHPSYTRRRKHPLPFPASEHVAGPTLPGRLPSLVSVHLGRRGDDSVTGAQ